jgi:membrane protease YdiL (CAAX protease family)
VLASIALAIGLNNIILLSGVVKYSKAYQEAAEVLYAPSFGMQILSTGLIIPIIEELLFRGLAFRILRKWIPFIWAAVTTAFLFGLYHGNLVQFIYATLCGLFLAYLCEKFQTVLASVTAHIVMNVTACTMTEFQWFSWMFENVWRVIVISMICALFFGILFCILQKMDVTKLLKNHCKE